jgi:hypothetical protein
LHTSKQAHEQQHKSQHATTGQEACFLYQEACFLFGAAMSIIDKFYNPSLGEFTFTLKRRLNKSELDAMDLLQQVLSDEDSDGVTCYLEVDGLDTHVNCTSHTQPFIEAWLNSLT